MKILIAFSILITLSLSLSAKPKNFVVMIADDISACDITSYGNSFVNTHNIESLAQQGIVFDRAYLTASSCSPSRVSIITSRYPHNNGEAGELHRNIPLHLATLPKTMRDNGYFTMQSGKSHFGGTENNNKTLENSFDIHDEARKEKPASLTGSGNWVKCLRQVPKDKPFFAWFASRDAHRPWDDYWQDDMGAKLKPKDVIVPPELVDDNATRTDLANYYNEVKRFDYAVGLVVKELESQGILEETFVIVLADNGRAFPRAKTRTSNDIGGKAMMIVYCPSYSDYKGVRSASLLSTIDIAPTILELANIAKPESFQGISFAPILKDKNVETRDFVFAEQNWHDFSAHVRTVRYKDYSYTINARPEKALMPPTDILKADSYKSLLKLLDSGKELNPMQADIFAEPRASEEFYILSQDKHQVINQIANPEYAEIVTKLRKVMKDWQGETGDSVPLNYSKDKSSRGALAKEDSEGKSKKSKGKKDKKTNNKYYGEVAGEINDAEHINKSGIIKEE